MNMACMYMPSCCTNLKQNLGVPVNDTIFKQSRISTLTSTCEIQGFSRLLFFVRILGFQGYFTDVITLDYSGNMTTLGQSSQYGQ